MNFRVDNLQYCNWSRKIFEINHQAKLDAVHATICYHEDFDDLRNDEKFLAWLDEQPQSMSDGIYKNNTDAKWAARVIDLYKADTGLSKKKRGRPPASAADSVTKRQSKEVNVNGDGGQRMWKASEIGRMKPHEFEANEAELDKARAEGRIDYNA